MLRKYKVDKKLLEQSFNPLKPICENPLQQRDRTHEYRGFEDYLKYLKIIGNRIIEDYERIRLHRNKNKIKSTTAVLSGWEEIYMLQLDIESFVIVSRILLNRVGLLVEDLLYLRHQDQRAYSFADHKKWCLDNAKSQYKYVRLLRKMNWFDQNLSFMRDKVIEHGGLLAGSMRNLPNSFQYRRINKDFGLLSKCDTIFVENLIAKYGKSNAEIKSIKSNPSIMLDQFLNLIMKYNVKVDKKDQDKVGFMAQKYGMTVDVTILSKYVRQFLEDVASLFVYKSR